MACMQNNYQPRENSDSLILVELLMLSCTLMSFRHVWDIALALDTPNLMIYLIQQWDQVQEPWDTIKE